MAFSAKSTILTLNFNVKLQEESVEMKDKQQRDLPKRLSFPGWEICTLILRTDPPDSKTKYIESLYSAGNIITFK